MFCSKENLLTRVKKTLRLTDFCFPVLVTTVISIRTQKNVIISILTPTYRPNQADIWFDLGWADLKLLVLRAYFFQVICEARIVLVFSAVCLG